MVALCLYIRVCLCYSGLEVLQSTVLYVIQFMNDIMAPF